MRDKKGRYRIVGFCCFVGTFVAAVCIVAVGLIGAVVTVVAAKTGIA